MAGGDNIQIIIGGDSSGLQSAMTRASASMEQAASSMQAASEKIKGAGAGAEQATGSFNRLNNMLAMGVGRVAGMETGMGMLGGVIGRVAGAAGAAIPFIAALIPLAVIGAVYEFSEKMKEAGIALAAAQDKMAEATNKQDDALLAQKEELIGITSGPLAKYAQQLKDIPLKAVNIDIAASIGILKAQESTFKGLVAEMTHLIPVNKPGAYWEKLYDLKDGELFITQQKAQYDLSKDFTAMQVAYGEELKKIHEIEATQPENSYAREQTEDARKAIEYQMKLNELTREAQTTGGAGGPGKEAIIKAEMLKQELADAEKLAGIHKADADEQAKADREHQDALAKQRADLALQALPKAGGEADTVTAAQERLSIVNDLADQERDHAKTDIQQQLIDYLTAQSAKLAAAQGDQAKINEINAETEAGARKFSDMALKADDDANTKKVQNASRAADEIAAINQRIVNDAIRDAEETARTSISAAERTESEVAALAEKRASMGIETKERELHEVIAAQQTELSAIRAAYAEEIEALREKQAAFAVGSPEEIKIRQQIIQLQNQQAIAEGKITAAIKEENAELPAATNAWSNYFAKLNIESQFTATNMNRVFQSSLTQMNTGFASAVGNWIENGGKFSRSMENLGVHMLVSFTESLIKMGIQYVETHLFMAATGKAIQTSSNVSQIMSQAALAGASGVASFAAAPFPVNAGAPAFGAAMFADAASYAGAAAAEQGGFIPGRAGQATPIIGHGGELVIPEHISSFLNTAASSAVKGGGAGIRDMHFHMSVVHSGGEFDAEEQGAKMWDYMQKQGKMLGIKF
jgi:hypothetical protein